MVGNTKEEELVLAAFREAGKEEARADQLAFEKAVGSPEGWRESWRVFSHFPPQHSMLRAGKVNYNVIIDGKTYEGWRWVEGKEIRVFTDGRVDERAVIPVVTGINELLNELNLDLKVSYYKSYASHPSVTEPVKLSMENGFLDADKLFEYFVAEPWRSPPQGGQHADVLIANRPLKVGGENFGESVFYYGSSVLSLTDGTNNPKDKRNRQERYLYDLVRRIAKHEAGHLLGYDRHHETVNVSGYAEPADCAMYWRCSTDVFCSKCKDALLGMWEGLEQKTGMSFFK